MKTKLNQLKNSIKISNQQTQVYKYYLNYNVHRTLDHAYTSSNSVSPKLHQQFHS